MMRTYQKKPEKSSPSPDWRSSSTGPSCDSSKTQGVVLGEGFLTKKTEESKDARAERPTCIYPRGQGIPDGVPVLVSLKA